MPQYKMTITVPASQEEAGREHVRAVEAKNEARALAHVTADTIKVEKLTVAEAMDLASKGVRLEQAKGGDS